MLKLGKAIRVWSPAGHPASVAVASRAVSANSREAMSFMGSANYHAGKLRIIGVLQMLFSCGGGWQSSAGRSCSGSGLRGFVNQGEGCFVVGA
jgi:hypothetical protein